VRQRSPLTFGLVRNSARPYSRFVRRIVLTLVLVGCGARTPLGTIASTQPETCTPKAPSCDHWVLGDDHLIEPFGAGLVLGPIAATECGALISWEKGTGASFGWKTTRLTPDGSRSDEPDHTTFPDAVGDQRMWLAARGSRIAAMLGDAPCRFVPLDAHGANAGTVVQTGDTLGACRDLMATNDGYSFLSTPTGELFNLDSVGALTSQTALNDLSTRTVWNRARLDDGSFILNSFSEDSVAVVYKTWLRHFDSKGAPLADEVLLDSKVAPVHVAQSASGLLVAWQWSALEVLPTNRDGIAVGSRVDIPMAGPPYGMELVSLPNGDAMALSIELSGHDFSVTAHQLTPTSAPRVPPLTLPFHPANQIEAVVSPSGDVLIAYLESATHDLHVQSLTCVP
jgi:hypothetical protein